MKETLIFKDGVDVNDLKKVSPNLLIVLGYYVLFCKSKNLRCCITSISDFVEGRVSETHEKGRAFDASVTFWKMSDVNDCINFMNEKVGHLGAISKKDMVQRVVVFHMGTAEHFHFQVKE